MKKGFKFLVISLFLIGYLCTNIWGINAKKIKKNAIDSIVKVITENSGKRMIATGVALDRNHLLTSLKILSLPNYTELFIVNSKGEKYPVQIKGKDPESSLLLLSLNQKILTPFKFAQTIETGDSVILLGGFYKEFPALFQGIVSSVNNNGLIIDSSVVPGLIGGAVLNSDGHLLGIVKGKIGFSSGIDLFKNNQLYYFKKKAPVDLCYAIPFRKVNYIYNSLKKFSRVKRSWVGIQMEKDKNLLGIKVVNVSRLSPAEEGGLKRGDVILSLNKIDTINPSVLSQIINTSLPGRILKVKFQRDNQILKTRLKLAELKNKIYTQRVEIKSLSYNNSLPEFNSSFPKSLNFQFNLSNNSEVYILLDKINRIKLNLSQMQSIPRPPIPNYSQFNNLLNSLLEMEKNNKLYFMKVKEILERKSIQIKNQIQQLKLQFQIKNKKHSLTLKKDLD